MATITDDSTWVEIDLGTIRNNVRYLINQTRVGVMAVVKAQGYGHGAIPVARATLEAGATWCGVARIEEAMELRNAGINCPILLLGYTPPGSYAEAIQNQLSITIWDGKQCAELAKIAQTLHTPARVHLKVDTGLSRLGVQVDRAIELIDQLTTTDGILFEGIFTHFACADEADTTSTDEQLKLFNELINILLAKHQTPALIHASNSAGVCSQPNARFNLVRLGIALYGLQPSKDWKLPIAIQPALTWKTVLSQVKTLPPHRGVSYGHIYHTQGYEKIGTMAIGYADGFRRINGNHVLIRGKRAPVVGRICMDQAMVNLDEIPDAQAGDEVVLIGQQGKETITAEELGETWNTINYEVVCGIGQRVPRIYK
jgi:alanine racemase